MTVDVCSGVSAPPPPPQGGEGGKKPNMTPHDVKVTQEKPKTQEEQAPAPAEAKKAAIMYFAGQLFTPKPREVDLGLMIAEGAYYLAEQQANRQNHSPAKETYDNVFSNREAQTAMENVKRRHAQLPISEDPAARAIHHTIVNSQNLLETDVDWSKYSKIYIPGYGQAGARTLEQAYAVYTPDEVAERLISSRALDYITDIRITSHGSADARWTGEEQPMLHPMREPQELNWFIDDAAGAVWMGLNLVSGAIRRLAGAAEAVDREIEVRSDQAFALEVSRELRRRGYGHVSVYGYMGEEMPLPDSARPHHHRYMGQGQEQPRRSSENVRIRFQQGRQQNPPAAPVVQFQAPPDGGDQGGNNDNNQGGAVGGQ